MPRALREFSDVMPEMTVTAYPVENGSVDMASWWLHRDTALLLQREYIKYLGAMAMTAIS